MRDSGKALGVVLGAAFTASCGSWLGVPGGGQQTLRFVTEPTGAVLTLTDEQGDRELGAAPAQAVVSYEMEQFEANHHCWWWPGLSAATATAGGVVLGVAGLGQCVDRTGASVGTSESTCAGQWRPGALNTAGVAGTALLVSGGVSALLGALSCGLQEARDGDEHPVYRIARVRARAPGHRGLETEVDIPSPVKDILLTLEPGEGDEAPAPASGAGGDVPSLAQWSRSSLAEGAEQPKSYALIVGVEQYAKAAAVPGARRDAERFRDLCTRTLGVSKSHQRVALDQRATRREIEGHLRWLRSRLDRGGRLYFYYAGQGTAVAATGASYLLPYDGDPAALDRTALPTRWLLDELAATTATEVWAVVDAGFGGNGGRSFAVPGAKPVSRVSAPAVKPVVALLDAAGGTEVAGSGADGEGGWLTVALVHGLGTGEADVNRDGQITLREIAGWVTPQVGRFADGVGRQQTPALIVGRNVDPAVFVVAHGLSR